jgi:hypothetical protein
VQKCDHKGIDSERQFGHLSTDLRPEIGGPGEVGSGSVRVIDDLLPENTLADVAQRQPMHLQPDDHNFGSVRR